MGERKTLLILTIVAVLSLSWLLSKQLTPKLCNNSQIVKKVIIEVEQGFMTLPKCIVEQDFEPHSRFLWSEVSALYKKLSSRSVEQAQALEILVISSTRPFIIQMNQASLYIGLEVLRRGERLDKIFYERSFTRSHSWAQAILAELKYKRIHSEPKKRKELRSWVKDYKNWEAYCFGDYWWQHQSFCTKIMNIEVSDSFSKLVDHWTLKSLATSAIEIYFQALPKKTQQHFIKIWFQESIPALPISISSSLKASQTEMKIQAWLEETLKVFFKNQWNLQIWQHTKIKLGFGKSLPLVDIFEKESMSKIDLEKERVIFSCQLPKMSEAKIMAKGFRNLWVIQICQKQKLKPLIKALNLSSPQEVLKSYSSVKYIKVHSHSLGFWLNQNKEKSFQDWIEAQSSVLDEINRASRPLTAIGVISQYRF